MKIRLYGYNSCGPCQQIKRLLDKLMVEYEYVDVLKEGIAFDAVPIIETQEGKRIIGLGKDMTAFIRGLVKERKGKNKGRMIQWA